MKIRFAVLQPAVLLATVLLIAEAVVAQAPPAMPKPGPEVKKLGYFVGHWNTEGEMKPGPMGPGGKFTTSDQNSWLAGKFFLILRSDGTTPMGPAHEIAVMGYNSEEKIYTYDPFDNYGEHDPSKGTLEGDTWTWNGEMKMGGQVIKGKFTAKEVSPTEYTFKYEMSTDGTKWTTAVEGKSTKVTEAHAAAAENKPAK
jgi:hypothetical protein